MHLAFPGLERHVSLVYDETKKCGEEMIVRTVTKDDMDEATVTIEARRDDPELARIMDALGSVQGVLVGIKDDRRYPIPYDDVHYVESIDDQGFIYTKKDVFDSRYRLYEVEEASPFFVRVNKSTVVNINKIAHFRSTANAKLEATLTNGDRIDITRTYVPVLKAMLGGRP